VHFGKLVEPWFLQQIDSFCTRRWIEGHGSRHSMGGCIARVLGGCQSCSWESKELGQVDRHLVGIRWASQWVAVWGIGYYWWFLGGKCWEVLCWPGFGSLVVAGAD